MSIETRYHVEIYFEFPQGVLDDDGYNIDEKLREEITDALFDLCRDNSDVEDLSVNGGGPCFGPYLTCWSRFRITATLIERELETLLRSRGCTITESD